MESKKASLLISIDNANFLLEYAPKSTGQPSCIGGIELRASDSKFVSATPWIKDLNKPIRTYCQTSEGLYLLKH